MLTGKESLVRLFGKRRRFLPNRQSIVSSQVQSSLNLFGGNDGMTVSSGVLGASDDGQREGSERGEAEGSSVAASGSAWVTCPVCGSNIPSGDHMINSHLDACLPRKSKRKLTQCTLLQLNFLSRSKGKLHSSALKQNGNGTLHKVLSDSLQDANSGPINILSEEDKNTDQPLKIFINEERKDSEFDSHLVPVKDEDLDIAIDASLDSISGVALETFIVGRKFSDEKELIIGANILLQRDPNNVKDLNAIKVLSVDYTDPKVLGYVPRELAQYLSPLIDEYNFTFQGIVIAVPKQTSEIVPIEIVCHKDLETKEESHSIGPITNLIRKALEVAGSIKNRAPTGKRYHRNFCLLLQDVLRSNDHLFTENEKTFLESFTALPEDSQRLFVRLYMRKGPWFRLSSIAYSEILDSQEAVEKLSASGYLCTSENTVELDEDDLKSILALLAVSEIQEIIRLLKKKLDCGLRKVDLIATLLSYFRDGPCSHFLGLILERTGICIRISSAAELLIWRAERLFFLNGEQNLASFLLVDLGFVKYPTYKCIVLEQIFSTRSDLLAYEEAIEVAQLMDQFLDENDIELLFRCIMLADSRMDSFPGKSIQSTVSEPGPAVLPCFSHSWVYSKVVLLGVSFLECNHRYGDAVHYLRRLLSCFPCDARRGYWTVRLSVDLEHIGCLNESLSVAENGLLDPYIRAGSRMALQRRVVRLSKPPRRWKVPSFAESIKRNIVQVHFQGRPVNCETGAKSRFYGEDGEQCGVEQLALQYYAVEGGGWEGVHTESGIWLTIFGLVMWEILFCDIPNAFRTKFQTAPLDLETESFFLARKGVVENHLQKISDGMAEEMLITSWESHLGTACRGVNWEQHSLSQLRAAVTCVTSSSLASLCRHLAQDYRSWSSGMPDLLLWRFHGDYSGEAKLVEVKGPRDRLSEQQRACLLLLMDCGFNVEVCKVSPPKARERGLELIAIFGAFGPFGSTVVS